MNLNEFSRFDLAADEHAARVDALYPIECVLEACDQAFEKGDDYVEIRVADISDFAALCGTARQRAACEADYDAFVERMRLRPIPGVKDYPLRIRWEAA